MRYLIVVLLFVMAGGHTAFAQNPMQFTAQTYTDTEKLARRLMNDDEIYISASGQIVPGTLSTFQKFVRDHAISHASVYLDSPGGSLIEGLALGEEIRRQGFDTRIGHAPGTPGAGAPGLCASACAYVFAGGHNRFFAAGDGQLGLHQFSTQSNVGDLGTTQVASAQIVEYLTRMGVSPDAFVVAASIPSNDIFWLTPSQAVQLKLSNNGILPLQVEIRLINTEPYIWLQQERLSVTSRATIFCGRGEAFVMLGVVATPAAVQDLMSSFPLQTNYLEFDHKTLEVRQGKNGLLLRGDVLWFQRDMNSTIKRKLASSSILGAWMDSSPGDVRWGIEIDLTAAQSTIQQYLQRC